MKKIFFLFSLFVFASLNTFAQCKYGGTEVPIINHPFKIKVATGVSSETARTADYVEFRTMEDIYSLTTEGGKVIPKVLFAKDTPIYGTVTKRKHRHFPFVRGKLEIELEPLINWDGSAIQIAIARHRVIAPTEEETRNLTEKQRRTVVDDLAKGQNKPCKVDRDNCVAGRGNAAVAPLVPAVAAAGAAAITAVTDEDETRFIAATAFFSIAKEVGNLVHGTDVEISKDAIFDLHISETTKTICRLPEQVPATPPAPTKVPS